MVIHDIVYPSPGAPNGEHLLDLYVPSSGAPTRPYTVVVIHGGSSWAGDKADMAGQCAALADLGYAVISPNYTLVVPPPSGPGLGSFPQRHRGIEGSRDRGILGSTRPRARGAFHLIP